MRQVRALGRFVDTRLQQGLPHEQVVAEFPAVIEDSDVDRGYSCMVDRTGNFISHPMERDSASAR
ncbi:MAG: hypothetical protein P8R42_06400 [Candidatus Binatia bacterium]|nr:hypothetical protein [Candidatus Binatia bacterium]